MPPPNGAGDDHGRLSDRALNKEASRRSVNGRRLWCEGAERSRGAGGLTGIVARRRGVKRLEGLLVSDKELICMPPETLFCWRRVAFEVNVKLVMVCLQGRRCAAIEGE